MNSSQESEASGPRWPLGRFQNTVAWRELVTTRLEVCCWRTANLEQVDFVIEARRQLISIEVRATTKRTCHDARHLRTFGAEIGKAVYQCLLVYGGDETYWLSDRVLAALWWRVV